MGLIIIIGKKHWYAPCCMTLHLTDIKKNWIGLKKYYSIVKFFIEFGTDGTKLFRRPIASYQVPKRLGIHHIREGEALDSQLTPKKLLTWKLGGSPPKLVNEK